MEEKIERFFREKGVILPKDFVTEVYSQILKIAGPFSGLIRRGSVEAGRSAARAFKENSKVENVDLQTLSEIIVIFFKAAGFGEIDVSLEGNNINLFVKDSFLLKAHPDEEKALSPLLGAIEGFTSEYLNRNVRVESKGRNIRVITTV